MTREDLRGIIDGISEAQLKRILDINSADIGKAKKDADELRSGLDTANKTVATLSAELETLKAGQSEAEQMKMKVEELQKVIDDRKCQDEQAAKDAAVLARFESASSGAKFLNEFTKNGVLAQFSEALESDTYQGKSDSEIFDAITADVGNLFVSGDGVPSVVASTSGFGADLSMNDVREIMGLDSAM